MGYWPRSLHDAEKRYETTYRECLAEVWALLLLRTYLEGTSRTIRTDHDSFHLILNMAGNRGKIAR